MTKITLQDLESLTNEQSALTRINANNAEIETQSDTFLSRAGTAPNTMLANLDMNSKRILNLPPGDASTEPVTMSQFEAVTLTAGDAPFSAAYVTMALHDNLTNERVLTAGTNVTVTDAGGNSTVTLDLPTTLNFTGKTITSGTYSSPTLTTPTIGAASGTSLSLSSTTPLTFTGTSATLAVNSGSGNNGLTLKTRGSGSVNFQNDSGETFYQLSPNGASGIVNYLQCTGNITANAPYFAAQGETNVGVTFLAKGTGNLVFGVTGTTYLTLSSTTATSTTAIKSSNATGGIGYATGAGGTVAQATNKSTGVTLSKTCGAITMDAASLAAGTIVSFVLTNTAIAATDVLVLNHISGGTVGSYTLNAQCAAGSATINVRNNTAGALAEAIVIQFAVVKGVNA